MGLPRHYCELIIHLPCAPLNFHMKIRENVFISKHIKKLLSNSACMWILSIQHFSSHKRKKSIQYFSQFFRYLMQRKNDNDNRF